MLDSGAVGPGVQIAAATLSGNSLRQTVHTHRASVHQAAKFVPALLKVTMVAAGLAESNGSLPPGVDVIGRNAETYCQVYDSSHLQDESLQCFDAVGWASGL